MRKKPQTKYGCFVADSDTREFHNNSWENFCFGRCVAECVIWLKIPEFSTNCIYFVHLRGDGGKQSGCEEENRFKKEYKLEDAVYI